MVKVVVVQKLDAVIALFYKHFFTSYILIKQNVIAEQYLLYLDTFLPTNGVSQILKNLRCMSIIRGQIMTNTTTILTNKTPMCAPSRALLHLHRVSPDGRVSVARLLLGCSVRKPVRACARVFM